MSFAAPAAIGMLTALLVSTGTAQPDQQLVTAASNVRVRAAPSVEVEVLTTLPLGTDLAKLQTTADGRWVRVRLPDSTEGWILESLAVAVPSGRRLQVIERLIGWRLARDGDGFAARLQLLELIERTAAGLEDREQAATFALHRLHALDGVLRSIPFIHRRGSEPFASWLAAHDSLVVYSEPGGRWLLRREAILAEHDRYEETRSAQAIAWLAATNGLPGECEGDVPCYVGRSNRLHGEFLRRHPDGSRVPTAFGQLIQRAAGWPSLMDDARFFNPARDCSRLGPPLASLRAAVEGADFPSPSPGSGEAQLRLILLRLLDEVARPCEGSVSMRRPSGPGSP